MDSRMANLDVDKLIERISEEVARRFARGTSLKTLSNGVGPPFCAACSTPGQCAKICPDPTSAVVEHGAARVTSAVGMGALDRKIAAAIDHTLLKPEATRDEVTLLCAEAAKYVFASVCVNPFWVPLCAKLLSGHPRRRLHRRRLSPRSEPRRDQGRGGAPRDRRGRDRDRHGPQRRRA